MQRRITILIELELARVASAKPCKFKYNPDVEADTLLREAEKRWGVQLSSYVDDADGVSLTLHDILTVELKNRLNELEIQEGNDETVTVKYTAIQELPAGGQLSGSQGSGHQGSNGTAALPTPMQAALPPAKVRPLHSHGPSVIGDLSSICLMMLLALLPTGGCRHTSCCWAPGAARGPGSRAAARSQSKLFHSRNAFSVLPQCSCRIGNFFLVHLSHVASVSAAHMSCPCHLCCPCQPVLL